MAKRKIRYPDKPHTMDPEIERRFQEIIDRGKGHGAKLRRQIPQPKDGWQLWDWKTFEDRPQ